MAVVCCYFQFLLLLLLLLLLFFFTLFYLRVIFQRDIDNEFQFLFIVLQPVLKNHFKELQLTFHLQSFKMLSLIAAQTTRG